MNVSVWMDKEAIMVFGMLGMLLVMMLIGVTIFKIRLMRKGDTQSIQEPAADLGGLEHTVSTMIEEHLRIHAFDTAMVLMEKQRLKKLEIEELSLRLRLMEIQMTGANPCSQTSSI